MLGFRGKLAFGNEGEVQALIRRMREKIARTRGAMVLCRVQEQKPGVLAAPSDPWIKRLVLITAAMLVLAIVAFAASYLLLTNQLSSVQAQLDPSILAAPTRFLASIFGSIAL